MAGTKFTKARRERIIEALRRGHYLKHAAALAGVGESTVQDWLRRGRDAKPGTYRLYREFAAAVDEADADMIDTHLTVIGDAEDPRISMEFLGRRHPELYGRIERREVSGPKGEPITVELKWPEPAAPPR